MNPLSSENENVVPSTFTGIPLESIFLEHWLDQYGDWDYMDELNTESKSQPEIVPLRQGSLRRQGILRQDAFNKSPLEQQMSDQSDEIQKRKPRYWPTSAWAYPTDLGSQTKIPFYREVTHMEEKDEDAVLNVASGNGR